MNVRPLRDLADVQEMEAVNRRAWRTAYDGIFPQDLLTALTADPSPHELRHRFEQLSEWTGSSLVAEDGDEIVGYAVVRWGADTEAYVDERDVWLKELYVDPDHWGAGVGTALLEHAAAAAPADREGIVASMLAANPVGERFYESKGFEAVDEWSETIAGEEYPTVVYRLPL